MQGHRSSQDILAHSLLSSPAISVLLAGSHKQHWLSQRSGMLDVAAEHSTTALLAHKLYHRMPEAGEVSPPSPTGLSRSDSPNAGLSCIFVS